MTYEEEPNHFLDTSTHTETQVQFRSQGNHMYKFQATIHSRGHSCIHILSFT